MYFNAFSFVSMLSDQKLNNIEQNTKMFQHEKSTTKKKSMWKEH